MSAEQLAGLTADELPPELQQYAETGTDDDNGNVAEGDGGSETELIEEQQVDPIIAKAQGGGWTDKATWETAGKDPDQWVDAKEFVSRAPLYERNRELKRALAEQVKKTEAVSRYASKVAETTRAKVLAELDEQRLKAVEIGDTEGFKAIEQRIDEVRKEAPELELEQEQQRQAPEIPPFVTDFANRNAKWFEKDRPMTVFMVAATKEYTESGKPLEEAMKLAEADVKREFAHKFVNPNKERPGAVGSNSREARPNNVTYADLTSEQRTVWAAVKKSGMTFEDFVSGLKEQGEFK